MSSPRSSPKAREWVLTHDSRPDLGPPIAPGEVVTVRESSVTPDPSKWIRAFNRLERAVTRHYDAKRGTGFCDDADDALHHAWRQVLKSTSPGGEDA